MKKAKVLIGCLTLVALPGLNGLTSCNNSDGPDVPTPPAPVEDTYKITLTSSANLTLEVGNSGDVAFDLFKNDEKDNSLSFEYEVSNDSIAFDATTKKVQALKKGKGVLTIWVKDHKESGTISINVNVVEYFFSREIQRGEINLSKEEQGSVTILGGQATLVAKKADVNFIFKATITLPETATIGTSQSFGIGSFLDNGDHALWFGAKNKDGENDGIYANYIRNFYPGWGSAAVDTIQTGYESMNVGNVLNFEIIRNGSNYAYSINGYHGKYTDTTGTEAPTYPGIYSQEIAFSVSQFSVDYNVENVENAYKGYDTKTIGSISINEKTKTRLLRGFTYNFTAKAYPDYSANDAKIVFSLDKKDMTSGADSTSITENGALTLGNDAAGKLKVIASNEDKTVKDELEITILETPDLKENDLLKVTGGVDLNDDGTVIFPEEMINVDGVGSEDNYLTTDYSAVLKNTYSKDFNIEFEVSDYKTTATFPKLQVALGGGRNNFYVVYKPDGTCRIEAFAGGVFQNGKYQKGWFNSNTFTDFDKNLAHKFKIEVASDGTYSLYQDGNKLTFSMDGNSAILKRDYETYIADSNVKFATKGVSAKVSNITINNGTTTDLPKYWKYNDNVTYNEESNELVLRMTDLGWANKDNYGNRVISTSKLNDNFAIDYDVEFSDAAKDSKLVLKIGNYEYQVNNKLASENPRIEGYLFKNGWNGKDTTVTNNANPLLNHVRLERNNGHIRFIINDTLIGESDYQEGDHIEFYAFNGDSEFANQTATIKNLSVNEYSMMNLYEFKVDGDNTRTINASKTDVVNLITQINGADVTDATFTYKIEDNQIISYDPNTKTVTGLKVGTTNLSITWVEANKTIDITYIITERPTESNLLRVNGGVLLEGENGLIFPTEHNGVNGVGNETGYEDNSYSANFKEKVKGDFEVEFTVSDYKVKEDVQYPKLMISLGGSHNQFYIAYNPNGEYRVETFTNFVNVTEDNSYSTGGSWVNSDNFTNFDPNGTHTYKISVVNGIYHIYMDGNELNMNINGTKKSIARRIEDYTTETPIRMSTNGVSCKVSDIKVTKLANTNKYYYFNNSNVTDVTDTGFKLKALSSSWSNKDKWLNRIALTNLVSENVTMTFNLKASGPMKDGKFMIELGGNTVMINFKNPNITANVNGIGHEWAEAPATGATYDNINAKIVRNNGNIKVYINDALIRDFDNCGAGGLVIFSVFNEDVSTQDVVIELSNLEIK